MSDAPRVWTVAEVTAALRRLLEQKVPALWVAGEVGDLTIHRSGHVYFTLKDGESQLSAVFFDGAAVAERLHLARGAQVEIYGRMAIYPNRGTYQLNVQTLRPRGQGSLQQQYEERLRKLRAEGLFDEGRKRRVPRLPRCIGVVTSPDGAALKDFMQVVMRRMRGVHVRLAPAAVQGADAANEMVQALADLVHHGNCDVIVLTRGGGSLEDLWSFNDERLARTIARCPVPVVSAVGHEVDYTIADFAADLRAPTPSAAAELVVPERDELQAAVLRGRNRLLRAMQWAVSSRRSRLEALSNHFVLRRPEGMVRLYQQRLDELLLRLQQAGRGSVERRRQALARQQATLLALLPATPLLRERRLLVHAVERMNAALLRRPERARERLSSLSQQLTLLSPQRVLDRGYAILQRADGAAVRSADDVAAGEALGARLAKGRLQVTVAAVEREEEPR